MKTITLILEVTDEDYTLIEDLADKADYSIDGYLHNILNESLYLSELEEE